MALGQKHSKEHYSPNPQSVYFIPSHFKTHSYQDFLIELHNLDSTGFEDIDQLKNVITGFLYRILNEDPGQSHNHVVERLEELLPQSYINTINNIMDLRYHILGYMRSRVGPDYNFKPNKDCTNSTNELKEHQSIGFFGNMHDLMEQKETEKYQKRSKNKENLQPVSWADSTLKLNTYGSGQMRYTYNFEPYSSYDFKSALTSFPDPPLTNDKSMEELKHMMNENPDDPDEPDEEYEEEYVDEEEYIDDGPQI